MQSEAQANANARATPGPERLKETRRNHRSGIGEHPVFALPCGARLSARAGPLERSLVLSIVVRLGAHPNCLFDPACLHPNARFG
jgi:hypothetical protein